MKNQDLCTLFNDKTQQTNNTSRPGNCSEQHSQLSQLSEKPPYTHRHNLIVTHHAIETDFISSAQNAKSPPHCSTSNTFVNSSNTVTMPTPPH